MWAASAVVGSLGDAGASFVTRGHSYRTFDWAKCKDMVDALMAGYPTPAAPPRKPAG
jgi:hypothetical protein